MIDRYLDRGDLWVVEGKEVIAVCVVTREGTDVVEIKNLAVRPEAQRKGYGRSVVEFVKRKYSDFRILRVGTGDSPLTLPFYQACGFREKGRIRNFFIDHYDHPIIEEGVQLCDMILLEQHIAP